MSKDIPAIYAVVMKDKPLRYSSSFPLHTVVAHACALSEEERKAMEADGCFFDDDCKDSISPLNPWWGELTAVHWLLQQPMEGIVGNAQYRRYWGDDSLVQLQPDCLYLCQPCYFGYSLKDQFYGSHSFPGYEMTMGVATAGKLPLTASELHATWHQSRFQGGPMAIASWSVYKRLMSVLFDCLWPIWDAYSEEIKALQGYDARAMAFLSERLLSGIALMPEKFLGNTPVCNIPLHYIP